MQKKKKSTKHMGPKPQYTRKEIKGPRIIAAKYNTSCVKADQYPEGDTVEIAFIGRSNVGKSSLINSLCNYRGLAELPPSSGAPEIDLTELVISLPAPIIREPLELNVLFAVPTMLL